MDACNELADSLYSQIHNHELSAIQKNDLILTGQLIVSKLEAQVLEKSITEDSYKKEAEKSNKKNLWLKLQRNAVFIFAAVEAVVITVLIYFI